MNKTFKLKSLLLSMVVAGAATASIAPTVAQAEVSYNAGASNFYLWRGQDISLGNAVITGGVDYVHDSGLYVGAWTSSEKTSTEFDLYAGYGYSDGDFSANVAYWAYFYPGDGIGSEFSRGGNVDGDVSFISEYELSASYADFSGTIMIDTEDTDLRYYSLNYALGDFGLHAGLYDLGDDDYTHFGVSYAATDSLSFTVSKAQGDGLASPADEKPLINVSYSFPL
ncbi:MAG: hypothetical protein JXK16_03855 [Thiotrichales bacterium]|nr:hypothetical protein [Thiotrichales bacterium]